MSIYEQINTDEDSREILTYCKTPRTSDEIVEHLWKTKRAIYPVSYGSKNAEQKIRTIVGLKLGVLEKNKALSFVNNKWETSETAISILAKYFGL